MNKTFAEYTTSIAFAITLTKAQCHVLLRIRRAEGLDHYCFHPHQARQLRVRGLVVVTSEKEREKAQKERRKSAIYKLTRAGELMCQLLDEAGIKLEKTQTPSLKKAEDFWKRTPATRKSEAS